MTYTLSIAQLTIFIMLAAWELMWKGLALWQAAHRHQPYWFASLLVINSAGVYPMLYILFTTMHDSREAKSYTAAPLRMKTYL